ncbi:MAG: tetratricopeptide repeat protein [Terriglobia bacterium]
MTYRGIFGWALFFGVFFSLPILAQQQTEERPALQHHHRGFALLQQNRLDEAIAEYQKALALEPTLGAAHAELALVFALKGDWAAAEASLEKAFQFDPNNPGIFVTAAIIHSLKGEDDKVIEDYKRAIALDPQQLDAHLNLGNAYLRRGKLALALSHFDAVLRQNPQDVLAQQGSCVAYTQAGALDTARRACTRARELDPGVLERLKDEAYRTYKSGNLEAALVRGQAATLADPTDADAWDQYGSLLGMANRYEEAIEQRRRALALKPDFARAHNNLGYALRQVGKLDEAIQEYETAIRLRPDYSLAHHNLGEAYLEKNDYPRAQDAFQHAIRIEPDYVQAKNDLAEAHAQWGLSLVVQDRFTEAEKHFNESLQSGEVASAYAGLCWVRLHSRSLAEARQAGDKAIGLDPNHAEGYGCHAALHYEEGDLQRAVADWQKAVSLDGENADLWMGLALGRLATGQKEEALEAYRNAVRFKPQYADRDALTQKGRVLWSQLLLKPALDLLELAKRE